MYAFVMILLNHNLENLFDNKTMEKTKCMKQGVQAGLFGYEGAETILK